MMTRGASVLRKTATLSSSNFGKFSSRSVSDVPVQVQEIRNRLQALKVKDLKDWSQQDVEEFDYLQESMIQNLPDPKLKEVFYSTNATINEIKVSLTQNQKAQVPPDWNSYRMALPFATKTVDGLEALYKQNLKASEERRRSKTLTAEEKVLWDATFGRLIDVVKQQQKDVEKKSTELQVSLKQQSEKISVYLREAAYIINNFEEMTVDSEVKRKPELKTWMEENILAHNWDPTKITFPFEKSQQEIEKEMLVDLLGKDHPLVASFNGDLKVLAAKLESSD